MPENHYDLVVIGSGPAGQKAAIAAAKLRKRVAVVDSARMLGGVCLHTGTIPSKTLREAVLYFSGYRQRARYGRDHKLKEHVTIQDLAYRVQGVVADQLEVVRDQLQRNDIEVFRGMAHFADPHSIEVEGERGTQRLGAEFVLVACGTRPAHNPEIPCDGVRIFDSDNFLIEGSREVPRTAIVVGGGIIGLEYASMLSALDVEVTLVEANDDLLDFADRELVEALCYHLRRNEAILRLGERVESVRVDERNRVVAALESGKHVHGEVLLYTVGRQANTDSLHLEAAGVASGSRGRLEVNENFQTRVPHIYAAGDVIGFPSLAATSMEQGRLASCHMFGEPFRHTPELLPYGIYTIPEISMVGRTEGQLTQEKVPYEVGKARFEELAKGQMIGDQIGMLKLLFHPEDRRVLGVHIIGDGASELVHIGQTVLALGGTVDYLRDTVFNYPTLAEAYKVAALDGLNKL